MDKINLDLIKKLREQINRPEKIGSLMSVSSTWAQLTTSLAVLEDSSLAIDYYIDSEYPEELTGKYLYTYGLLQALYLMEDAIDTISQTLCGKRVNFMTDYPQAYRVREMRNDVVGHPINRRGESSVRLIQLSLSKKGFEYNKFNFSAFEWETVHVNTDLAIGQVTVCINTVLSEIIDQLEREYILFVNKYKDIKMEQIFDQLDYARELVFFDAHLCNEGYKMVKTMICALRAQLNERYGEPIPIDFFRFTLEDVDRLLALIDDGLSELPDDKCQSALHYLQESLFAKLNELKKASREVDECFDSYGKPETAKNELGLPHEWIKEYGG